MIGQLLSSVKSSGRSGLRVSKTFDVPLDETVKFCLFDVRKNVKSKCVDYYLTAICLLFFMGYLSTNEENIPSAKLTRSHKSNFMFCKVTSSVFRCSFLCTLCKLTFCHKVTLFYKHYSLNACYLLPLGSLISSLLKQANMNERYHSNSWLANDFSVFCNVPGSKGVFCEVRQSDQKMLGLYTQLGCFRPITMDNLPQDVIAMGTSL